MSEVRYRPLPMSHVLSGCRSSVLTSILSTLGVHRRTAVYVFMKLKSGLSNLLYGPCGHPLYVESVPTRST